jgi:toluene monooxygenase system protein E
MDLEGGAVSVQKTYWHLAAAKRKPTEYEIVTSKLLYYVGRGLEVTLPTSSWNAQYQTGSPVKCNDWDRFYDPRQTTYTSYTELASAKETFTTQLLQSIDATGHDMSLSANGLAFLARVLPTLRYPTHGLQMIAAYGGHMAPESRVAVASLFQTADEVRRVQLLAYRTAQLERRTPHIGRASKALWEDEPIWQPLRELIERLLVAYDWAESLLALNLVVKPAFDELFMKHVARVAQDKGDDVLTQLFYSLYDDCTWHRDWTRALVATLLSDREENRAVIESWVDRWRPLAFRAVAAFSPLFVGGSVPFVDVEAQVEATGREHRRLAGLVA